MTDRLKMSHQLMVLRIELEATSRDAAVVITIEDDGLSLEVFRAATAAFGIPDDLDNAQVQGSIEFKLPPELIDTLRLEFPKRLEPDEPVWIQFSGSVGALVALPWERWFVSLEHPVLRYPYSAVSPLVSDSRMRVIVFATMPTSKTSDDLEQLVDRVIAVAQESRDGTSVDVFADSVVTDRIRLQSHKWLDPSQVTIHDPKSSSDPSSASSSDTEPSSAKLSNPWLRWATEALGSAPIDIVHFLVPGYHCAGQGSLAFPRSPVHKEGLELTRMLGGTELGVFLRSAGAWYVHLTEVTGDAESVGLRFLADELAQSRCGTVALDNPRTSTAHEALRARRFVLEDGLPPCSDTVIYCHPDLLARNGGDASVSEFVNAMTLAGSTMEYVVGQNLDSAGWVTATQRFLETQVGQLLATAQSTSPGDEPAYDWADSVTSPGDDPTAVASLDRSMNLEDDAANLGVAEALRFIADLVADSSSDIQ